MITVYFAHLQILHLDNYFPITLKIYCRQRNVILQKKLHAQLNVCGRSRNATIKGDNMFTGITLRRK